METEVFRSYMTAYRELVRKGDERTHHLTPTQKKHYEDLKREVIERHRVKLSTSEDTETLLVDIARGYEQLSPFWQMR